MDKASHADKTAPLDKPARADKIVSAASSMVSSVAPSVLSVAPLAIYLMIALLIMLPLLGPGYYVVLDLQFGPSTLSRFPDLYGFDSSPNGGLLLVRLVLAALSIVLAPDVVEKVLLLSILLLCGLSMHLSLPQKLGRSRYFAGLLYMLNPFVYLRFLVGHWSLLLSYALWPLALKAFDDLLQAPLDWKTGKKRLAKAALLSGMIFVSSHGGAMFALACAFVFIFRMWTWGRESNWKSHLESWVPMLRSSLVLGVIVLAMNLYWLIPLFLDFGSTYSPASASAYHEDFGVIGAPGLSSEAAVLTLHGFWREGFTYTKDVFAFWYIPFFIIAGLALCGMYILWKDDWQFAAALAAVFACAFLLSMGFFAWMPLADKISFAFRDSQKFVGLLALVYSIAGAYGVHALSGIRKGAPAGAILALVLLAVPVAYNYGFFGFLNQVGPTQYPAEWYDIERILASDPAESRMLVLPLHLYYEYQWVNGTQKIVANPAAQFFSKSAITTANIETGHIYSDFQDPAGNYLFYLAENRQFINDTAHALLPLDIRYILLYRHDELSIHYEYLFRRISGMPDIELVYKGKDYYLFRNNLATGPVLACKRNSGTGFAAIVNDSSSCLAIPYERITPASYGIAAADVPADTPTPYTYIVISATPKPYLMFGGSPVGSWHGIASFSSSEPPLRFENPIFPLVLALLFVWWVLCMACLADARFVVLASPLAAALFILVYYGMAGPAHLGLFFIVSFVATNIYSGSTVRFLKRR